MTKRWPKRWRREDYQKRVVERRGDWSFMAICHTIGLCPSPQSSLNPATWQGRMDRRLLR
jgi:hypothetical protein